MAALSPNISATWLLANGTYTQEQDQSKILNHHDSVKSLNILEDYEMWESVIELLTNSSVSVLK